MSPDHPAIVYKAGSHQLIAYTDLGSQTGRNMRVALDFQDAVCVFSVGDAIAL